MRGGKADKAGVHNMSQFYAYMLKRGVSHAEASKQIIAGIKIEEEHTPNKHLQMEIAFDHLVEFKRYYTALKEMEAKLKESDK